MENNSSFKYLNHALCYFKSLLGIFLINSRKGVVSSQVLRSSVGHCGDWSKFKTLDLQHNVEN